MGVVLHMSHEGGACRMGVVASLHATMLWYGAHEVCSKVERYSSLCIPSVWGGCLAERIADHGLDRALVETPAAALGPGHVSRQH